MTWMAAKGNPPWLAHPILVYLGRISYGLYVFHLPVILAIAWWAPGRAWLRLPLVAGLTLACAAGSYRYLESPFLRLKGRFTRVRSVPV